VDPSQVLLLPAQILNIGYGEIGECQLSKDYFYQVRQAGLGTTNLLLLLPPLLPLLPTVSEFSAVATMSVLFHIVSY
jgi:hypothetical protein